MRVDSWREVALAFGESENDFTVCVQPSFENDGKAFRESLQFDTEANILCKNKTRKARALSIVCCNEFEYLQNHIFNVDSDGGFAFIREHRSEIIVLIGYKISGKNSDPMGSTLPTV